MAQEHPPLVLPSAVLDVRGRDLATETEAEPELQPGSDSESASDLEPEPEAELRNLTLQERAPAVL